jgi:hypothetical protein
MRQLHNELVCIFNFFAVHLSRQFQLLEVILKAESQMELAHDATLLVTQWNLLAVEVSLHILKGNHLTFETLELRA